MSAACLRADHVRAAGAGRRGVGAVGLRSVRVGPGSVPARLGGSPTLRAGADNVRAIAPRATGLLRPAGLRATAPRATGPRRPAGVRPAPELGRPA
ncbi:hypothetical protein SAMN04488561_4909 [Jiangella alba]|uniref:Uncharacterized protein n=1 Tax=Jiangella alba TaxID=561176 RepID=A0A1H5PQP1_9ACTN|nr:hypothetical protein SAMN04488561_4909 [Jiangella alba]